MTSRICPKCGRHIPASVTVCRCGEPRAKIVVTSEPGLPDRPRREWTEILRVFQGQAVAKGLRSFTTHPFLPLAILLSALAWIIWTEHEIHKQAARMNLGVFLLEVDVESLKSKLDVIESKLDDIDSKLDDINSTVEELR
jgi:hypothetical protein